MEQLFSNQVLFGEEVLNNLHIFAGSWLDVLMAWITALGNEMFFVLMIPLMYWCVNKRLASLVGASFLVSALANDVAKHIYENPRPAADFLREGIREWNQKYIPQNSPGFPSGHTQNAVVFWGTLAWFAKRRIITIVSIVLIILIPYSRIYLGVHFLGDIIGGFILGAILLAILIWLLPWLEKSYISFKEITLLAIFLLLPLFLMMALPGHDIPKTTGVMSGYLIGLILAHKRIPFDPRTGVVPAILKFAVGAAGIILIKAGIKVLLPEVAIAEFFRYWLMGFWITFAAPLIFIQFKILGGRSGIAVE
ncbi:MAG: phosphatase PAP2 family protein [Spirochaetota bacterium]